MRIEPSAPTDPATSLAAGLGNLAEEYHVATRNSGLAKGFFKANESLQSPYVEQLAVEAPLHVDGRRVALPSARTPAAISVEEAITTRRSGRQLDATPLPVEHLATLLHLANGVRAVSPMPSGAPFFQRNVPNSGNLGSVEVFPVVLHGRGVEPGIYHFDTVGHHLTCLHGGRFDAWLQQRVLLQLDFEGAAAALVLTCALGRLQAKYGPRGYRLGLMDVGHVSANVYLVGTALGLAVCATAGFVDEELDRALGLDGLDTAVMLVLLVGTGS